VRGLPGLLATFKQVATRLDGRAPATAHAE
jgi:hypothetical protein